MRVVRVARLVAFYVRELIAANLLLAREVVTVKSGTSPGILRFPVRDRGPGRVALLAHMLSLLPGTLAIDVSEDHEVIYVHAIHASDEDALRHRIRDLEDRLREALW